MKRISLLAFVLTLSIFAKAQVSGVKNIPGDYATLAAAITALNTSGVGAGGVIINLNQAETAPTSGYILGSVALNATTSALNSIVINGGNNVITAQLNGINTTGDAVLRIAGTDYVTLNGLKIVENPANITSTTQMERAIACMNLTTTDACQNITIQNCNIKLNGFIQGNALECGIVFTHMLYTAVTTYTTSTNATTYAGMFDKIIIKGNVIDSCYTGIGAQNGASATLFQTSFIVGGTSLADGNTITNYGSQTTGVTGLSYGIYLNNVANNYVSYNTLSTTNLYSQTNHIHNVASPQISIVSNNNITFTAPNAVASAQNGIYHYSTNTLSGNTRCDSNNVHDISFGGTGLFYGIQHYNSASATATSMSTNNNIVTNITKAGISGNVFGIYTHNLSLTMTNRVMFNNLVSNFTLNSYTASGIIVYGYYRQGYGGTSRGNTASNISVANTNAGITNVYGFYGLHSSTSSNPNLVDSNSITGLSFTGVSGNIHGIYISNSSTTISDSYNRNAISNLSVTGGGTLSNIIGINVAVNGSGLLLNVNNNMISDLKTTASNTDNAIIGIDIKTGSATNNFINNNTIYLGSADTLTSIGTNFGVSGISFTAAANIKNNIVNVLAIPSGTGYVSAIRYLGVGVSGSVSGNFASGSSNNILHAIDTTNSHLYAECALNTAPIVFYNLTNDPFFNTACGKFKKASYPRGEGTFTENNLLTGAFGLLVPSGATYAESNSVSLASVVTDYYGVVRSSTSDCGAVEFAGTIQDASGPTISYTPLKSSTYCTVLPQISATITDASGINTTSGTSPRIYYKKSTENDTLVGNTNVDNGWKYVEASNTVSPFTFTINASLLTSALAVGDVIDYFIVAQDLATTPNVSAVSIGFDTDFCPVSVSLDTSAFPSVALPQKNQMTIVAPNVTLGVTASLPNVCLNGSTTLTVTDTILKPGTLPTGYTGPFVTGSTDDEIVRFQIVGTALNNSSSCSTTGGPAVNGLPSSVINRYSNYTSLVAPTTLTSGNTYTVNMDISNCSGVVYPMGISLWIDLNRNGILETATERVYGSTGTTNGAVSPGSTLVTFTFSVPSSGVVNGPTLMRVFVNDLNAGNTHTPTTTTTKGEIEDYWVNLNTINSNYINTLPNSSFTWTPSANIVTNPDRVVNATLITSNTIYTVTATDGGGCSYTSTKEILMADPVSATGVTGTTTYCSSTPNTSLTVTKSFGTPPYSSTWSGGPVVSVTGLTAVLNPPVGTTTYDVIVTDGCGSTSSTSVNVTVNPTPSVLLNPGTADVCTGTTKTESIVGASVTSTYTWMPGSLTGSTVNLSPSINTTYTISAVDGTCTASTTFTLTIRPLPSVLSTSSVPSTLVCAGDSIQINSTNNSPTNTIVWTPNTYINNNTIDNPKVAPPTSTTYTITVTNSFGCTATGTANANIIPLVTGTLSTTNDSICNGGSTTINGLVPTICGGNESLFQGTYAPANWSNINTNSNGVINTTGAPNSISLKSGTNNSNNPGYTNYGITIGCAGTITFNWSYSGLDAAFYEYPTYTLNGVTNVFPNFDINGGTTQSGTASIPVPAGATFQLQAYTEDNDINNCTVIVSNFSAPAAPVSGTINFWTSLTGGTNLGAPSILVSPLTTTTYYAEYTQTGFGCVNPFRDSITIVVNPIPSVTASATDSSVCLGSSTIFNGGGASTYTWSDGTNTPADATSFTPPSVGTSTYNVIGTDANGCTATSSLSLSVNALPIVTASVSSDSICLGSSTIFTGGGASTYSWTDGTNTPTDATSFTPSSTGSSVYVVTGTDANVCSATASVLMTVNALPTVTASSSVNPVCLGSSTIFTGGGASTYSWTDGTNTPTDATTFTPPSIGSSVYVVTGTDANLCSATSSISVTVNPQATFTSALILNSSCPGVNTGSAVVTSTGGAPTISYSISPIGPLQPSSGVFTTMIGGINYNVTLTDANSCTAVTTITATNPSNGGLANATNLNTASTSGNTCQSQSQIDGSSMSYYGATCDDLIVSVSDASGGNVLGNVNACVTVYPTVQTYNGQPYLPRTFDITPTNQGPATITLYFTQDDFDDYNAAAGSFPQIPAVQATGTATFCISQVPAGFLPGASGATTIVHTVTATWNIALQRWEVTLPVTSFSGFYCHACNPLNSALPAAIADFKGTKTTSTDVLTWTTTSELNNASFNVLYSNNGKEYSKLGTVNSKAMNGYSNQILTYSFENEKPTLGHNYYKLEQVDIDGKSMINTKVVDLIWGANGSTVSIYPNPTTDELNIDLFTTKAQNTSVKVLDMSGRVVKEIQTKSTVGANNIKLNLGEIATGVYTIQILENNQLTQVSKIEKK